MRDMLQISDTYILNIRVILNISFSYLGPQNAKYQTLGTHTSNKMSLTLFILLSEVFIYKFHVIKLGLRTVSIRVFC